jgi:hypothetical protein
MSARDEGLTDPWERAAAVQRLIDAIAEVVALARECGVDDETVLARLQDAADALREGLTSRGRDDESRSRSTRRSRLR